MTAKKSQHTVFHYIVTVMVYLIKSVLGEFIWLLIGLGGYFIFQTRVSPFDLLIGVPLIVISLSFILNSIFSQYQSIFSSKYNKAVCVLCN